MFVLFVFSLPCAVQAGLYARRSAPGILVPGGGLLLIVAGTKHGLTALFLAAIYEEKSTPQEIF